MKTNEKTEIICPKCGRIATSIRTQYGERNQCCDLWSWGEGSPLADKETHEARKAAHASFDIIWKTKIKSRNRAYKWLQKMTGLSKSQCHMKLMNAKQARQVERLAKEFISTRNAQIQANIASESKGV